MKKAHSKSKKIKQNKASKYRFILFVITFAIAGAVFIWRSSAASTYTANITFSASDGTWPAAVLKDRMAVEKGYYLYNYYPDNNNTYGPIINVTGTFKGLTGSRKAISIVYCGQTEPIGHYQYSEQYKTWGATGENILMSAREHTFVNGVNDVQLNLASAVTRSIDPSKPMICWAQVQVTESSKGNNWKVSIPVTQKLTLTPK